MEIFKHWFKFSYF